MSLALYCFDFLSSGMLNLIPFFPYYVIDFLVVLFPSAIFFDSIQKMICSKSSNSYSLSTVLILLCSSGLRVLFFFFFHYSIIILFQSIFQIITALSIAFCKYYFEEPLLNFPFISPNITLSFANRIRLLNIAYISRLFNIFKTRSFIEFLFSFLFYTLLIINILILLYFFVNSKITTHFVGITANLLGSVVMFPTFTEIFKKVDISDISFLLVLKFLFFDALELIILLYYKAPLLFIIGIALQLFFDIIFFIIFSIKKCLHQKIKSDNVNLISSTSTSEVNSPRSSFKSNVNSEDSQKDSQSDKSNENDKKYQLQLDDCVLQPFNKIDEKVFSNLVNVRFDFRFDDLNNKKNGQRERIRKLDFRFEELNKPTHYLC